MGQQEIAGLKERQQRCVCRMCGGPLELRLMIYNQYGGQGLDLYCPVCERVEYGTEPQIYQMAKAFVDKFEYNYFVDMEENQRNYQLNISKLCDIMAWALQHQQENTNG